MDLNTKVEVSDPSRFPGLRFPMILSDNLVGYGFNVHDDFVRPGYLLEEQSRGGLTVRMTLTADEPTVLASCAIYGDGRYPVLKDLFELMDAMPGILAQLERAEREEKFRAEFAQRIHTVDTLRGTEYPLEIGVTADGMVKVAVRAEKYHWDENRVETFHDVHDAGGIPEFGVWLRERGIVVPNAFLKRLDGCPPDVGKHWMPDVYDVAALEDPQFRAECYLSYENADAGPLTGEFPTLGEAMDFIGASGAAMAISGNSANVRIGTIRLYSTFFTSDGVDQGDSHIRPGMAREASLLHEAILERERQLEEAPSGPRSGP